LESFKILPLKLSVLCPFFHENCSRFFAPFFHENYLFFFFFFGVSEITGTHPWFFDSDFFSPQEIGT
jgi:hypothetical protein